MPFLDRAVLPPDAPPPAPPARPTPPPASPGTPLDDPERLRALADTGLLASATDVVLDRLADVVRRTLRVPVALVSIPHGEAQRFAGCAGPLPAPLDVERATPLSHSFCRHVVETGRPLVVPDARVHPVLRDNPAIAEYGVIAYLGVPLVVDGDRTLGAVCAIDAEPRAWGDDDLATLEALARTVAAELTSRMRAAQLAEASRQSEDLLRTSPDAFLSVDATGRITRVSDAAVGLLRQPRHELLARPLAEVLPPARFGDLAVAAEEAAARRTVEARELWVPALGRWFAVHAAPAEDGGLACWFRDVTQRTETQRALAASERRFRTVAQSAVDAIIATDGDGRIAFWTPAAERMFGWTMAEAVGRAIDLIVPMRHQGAHHAGMARLAAGGEPRLVGKVVEVPARRRSGEEFPCELSLGHYRDADGTAYFTAILRDVSARKAAEAALARANAEAAERDARYRAVVESLDVVVFRTDAEGRWTLLNSAWTRLTGHAVDDSLGRCFLDYVHEEDREGNLAAFEPLVRRTKPGCAHTVRYRTATGEVRWVSVRAQAEFAADDADAPCVATFGTLTDVTAQHEAEAALQAKEAELRQAQKMEAVGQLAGGVAHDFNNLLTAIRGFAELTMTQLRPGDPRRDDVREVTRAADRAAELVEQLLTFSRRRPAHACALRPAEVVENAERMLARVLGPDRALVSELAPTSGWTRVDGGQLEQVLLNLVVNARDAITAAAEPGAARVPGTITVAVHDLDVHGPHATLPAGDWVALRVTDTGIGMDAATRARIFEPFFTTKAPGEGTGLGLATVFGIVSSAGGRVLVESAPGAGSTFTVLLPRIPAPGAADDDACLRLAVDAAPGGAGETILLVEDEDALRRLGTRVLESRGWRVLAARHGADALALLDAHPVAPALAVTDLVMPTMGGRELVSALRARWPELPVLVMTGYTERAPQDDPALAGCGVLRKPYTAETLVRAVREALETAPVIR